jgi:hypothetical protein
LGLIEEVNMRRLYACLLLLLPATDSPRRDAADYRAVLTSLSKRATSDNVLKVNIRATI